MLIVLAFLMALLAALGHGATAFQPVTDPETLAIFAEDGAAPLGLYEFEGPTCGTFADEPCYIIVHGDLTIEVGP